MYLENPYFESNAELMGLLKTLWRGKFIIFGMVILFSLTATYLSLKIPNTYRASALLVPAGEEQSGLNSAIAQYGGLANLAGVSLASGGEVSRAQLGIEILRSRAFIGNFIRKHDLWVDLLGAKSWNQETGKILYDNAIVGGDSDNYLVDSQGIRLKESSLPTQRAYRVFSSSLSVQKNQTTGFITVSIQHYSPHLAAEWVGLLIDDLNQHMKERDVAEAAASIKFLEGKIAQTSLAELKSVFFELIQSQTETLMLTEARSEYIFRVVDPAEAPDIKASPNRSLIVILGTALGFLLSCVILLLRYLLRHGSRP